MAAVSVDLDREPEGVEDGAALLGIGFGKQLAKVGNAVENRAGFLGIDSAVLAVVGFKFGERRLGYLALVFQRPDALADEDRIDAALDCR